MRMTSLRTLLRRAAVVATAVSVAACRDQAPPPPSALVAVGDYQFTGTVAERLPSTLTVRVNDAKGSPVNGVPVTFTVADGGGSLTKLVDTTRSGGLATTNWTLGERAGTQRITASATALTSIDFTATARAGAPSTIATNGGTGQSVVVGTAVLTPPAVIVKDRFTNPVPGVSVVFTVASGGGTIVGNAATTNSAGIAAATSWTMGTTVGANTLTALALTSGITGNPVTFSATATAGAAARLTAVGSTSLTGTVFRALTPVPQVKVTDASGNAVAGAAVTFTGSAGSVVVGGSKTTDAAGLASPDGWALGTVTGSYTLTAAASGVTSATFTAAASADVANSMSIVLGNSQSALAGRPVAIEPSVKVVDVHNNAVAGIEVLFEVASGGGTAVGRRVTTNAQGTATVGGWTLGDAVGSNTLVASVQTVGVSVGSVTFTATGTAGAASTMTASAGQNQTAAAGSAVTTAPSVVVRDARGNGVAGVAVTFTVGSGGGTVVGGTATTNASGIAAVTSWTLGGSGGTQSLIARSTSLPDVTFNATATAGAAARMTGFSSQSQSGIVAGAALTASQRPAVRVTDAEGNPVTGASVTFRVAGNGTSGYLTASDTVATAVSNVNGIATVGAWTMPALSGTSTAIASISGVGDTVTFTVATTAGAVSRLRITAGGLSTLSTTAGATASTITITALDANNNTVTSYAGAKNLTFSGATAAPSTTVPTVNTTAFGTATSITFTNGVATGAMLLYLVETATISVTDGTYSSGTGVLTATVAAGAQSAISRVTPSSPTPSITGISTRTVTVKLVDASGNGIAGVVVTAAASNGTFASATGTTAADGTVTFSWDNVAAATAASQTLSFSTTTISVAVIYTFAVN
jgi:adhesin/invasin